MARYDWHGTPYEEIRCAQCGCTISAPASRMPHVLDMHLDRCRASTPQERETFRRIRRWPKRRRVG